MIALWLDSRMDWLERRASVLATRLLMDPWDPARQDLLVQLEHLRPALARRNRLLPTGWSAR